MPHRHLHHHNHHQQQAQPSQPQNYKIVLVDFISRDEPKNCETAIFNHIKQSQKYETYDPECFYDNIKTAHTFDSQHNSLVSLHLYSRKIHTGVEGESETLNDFSKREAWELYRGARCIVIFYRSSSVVWRMRRYLEKLILMTPLSMVMLVPIGVNEAHRKQIRTENGIFNAKGATIQICGYCSSAKANQPGNHYEGGDYTYDQSCDHKSGEPVDYVQLLSQLTWYCHEAQYNKFIKRRLRFLVKQYFPRAFESLKQNVTHQDQQLLEKAMDTVRESTKIDKKFEKLQEETKQMGRLQIILLTI